MKKVLIVEDDQIVANIYRNKFSVEGYEVEVALDGEVGLETLRSFRPDAVILDLMLPKMSGVELTKQIRAEPGCEQVPVIVFSNTYLTNLVQEAWKAGATKCLSKANCTPKQVIDVLRTTFGTNGAATKAAPAPVAPVAHVKTPPHPTSQPHHAPSHTNGSAMADSDAEFQADLRKTFINGLPATLSALRTQLQTLIKADTEEARIRLLQEMYRRIHAMTGNAGLSGLVLVAQVGDAIEALLKELFEKPKNINPSTLRTVATAIDFLGVLFERGLAAHRQELPQTNILVVDDEAISRRAVTYALEKAKLKSVSVEDPLVAYKLLSEGNFDLVFLDVDMPGMNGYELCTKLRALPGHKKTPVVFVTSLNDFENRASSTMSGGNDFIGKPFLFIELAVKALIYILRARFATAR
jgi:DNA-binding response OmpR family regulator